MENSLGRGLQANASSSSKKPADVLYDQPALLANLTICIDLDLFTLWNKAGAGVMNGSELAQLVGIDVELLSKISWS